MQTDGLFWRGSKVGFRDVTDGTSNTCLMAEGLSGARDSLPTTTLVDPQRQMQLASGGSPCTRPAGPQTGHRRRYDVNPYFDYFRSSELMFPVGATDAQLPQKSRVLGVVVGEEAKAYPLPDPDRERERGVWQDMVGGQTLRFAQRGSRSGTERWSVKPPTTLC